MKKSLGSTMKLFFFFSINRFLVDFFFFFFSIWDI